MRAAYTMPAPDALPLFHVVGFSGHRQLTHASSVEPAVKRALEALRKEGSGEWIAMSSIAEGGDMVFARQSLLLGLTWHAILPLPPAEFRKDFSDAAWREVESFLAEAEQVRVVSETGEREDAYLDAGMETVHACDVLLVVWDGAPARGKGGTADVVAYARELKKPLVIVDATTGEIRREHFEYFAASDDELEFLNALPAAPAGGYEAANVFNAPKELHAFQKKADYAASKGAPHFRWLTSSIVILHAVATVVAASALAFDLHLTAFPWVKLVCVVGALAVAYALRHYHHQHTWVRCRLAAEVGRSSLLTWGLPRAAALFEDLDFPEIRQLTRTLQIQHRRAIVAHPVPMAEFKAAYLQHRIDDQLSYYRRKLGESVPQLTRLRAGFVVANILAIVCTAAYAIDHTWHFHWLTQGGESLVYYFLPISLPVIAAALMSLISINDLHRRVARYHEMQHVLESARKQISFSQTWNSLERIVRRTERALLQEVIEWHTLTSHIESH